MKLIKSIPRHLPIRSCFQALLWTLVLTQTRVGPAPNEYYSMASHHMRLGRVIAYFSLAVVRAHLSIFVELASDWFDLIQYSQP
jgi:hypothetical protein